MSNFPEIEYRPLRPDGEGLAVEPEATPLDFLSAVYRDQRQSMQRRMRAAEIAAQYVHPTFKAMAVVHADGSFAERLERCIERSQNGGSLRQVKTIEAAPVEHSASELRPTATPAPRPEPQPFYCRPSNAPTHQVIRRSIQRPRAPD